MSLFNDKLVEALFTGNYVCSQCGSKMEFEDERRDTLVCNKCGHSVDLDLYGSEDESDYSALYPPMEDIIDDDEDIEEEVYEEECGELDND